MAAQLTSDEWLALYRYLLEMLRQSELTAIALEIEAAASHPVIIEPSPEENARVLAISRDVSKTAVRARTPEEAFAAATSVLSARLVEIPAIAQSIEAHLEGKEVVFRESEGNPYSPTQQSSFSMASMRVSPGEIRILSEVMALLIAATIPGKSL